MSSLDHVMDLLSATPVADGHNDVVWECRERGYDFGSLGLDTGSTFHTDWPRARAGRLGMQFWSVYVPGNQPLPDAVVATLEQIDGARRMIERYPDTLGLATTADEAEAAMRSGRIASFLGAEGGQSIAGSLGVLRCLHRLGVRYMTLTHNENVGWADSATDAPDCGGLTDLGRDVVAEMNRLGMLVDLSHVAASTMNAALDASRAPVIFSHSGARSICPAPRNVPDDVLARLADNGGVCMDVFAPAFVSTDVWEYVAAVREAAASEGLDVHDYDALEPFIRAYSQKHTPPKATLAQVADHIERIRDIAGVEHVGIGGDFDGVTSLPLGLEDVSCYPRLFAELADRGWSDADLSALASGNILRVLREAESVARTS